MVGKLIFIGTIKINYYETDYDRGYKGKLKSIGTVEFIYFRDTYENKKADIVGKFQKQIGQDERLIIYQFVLIKIIDKIKYVAQHRV